MYYLVVSCGNYNHWAPSSGATESARSLHAVLELHFSTPNCAIHLADPTGDSLLAALDEFSSRLGASDTFFFCFAGRSALNARGGPMLLLRDTPNKGSSIHGVYPADIVRIIAKHCRRGVVLFDLDGDWSPAAFGIAKAFGSPGSQAPPDECLILSTCYRSADSTDTPRFLAALANQLTNSRKLMSNGRIAALEAIVATRNTLVAAHRASLSFPDPLSSGDTRELFLTRVGRKDAAAGNPGIADSVTSISEDLLIRHNALSAVVDLATRAGSRCLEQTPRSKQAERRSPGGLSFDPVSNEHFRFAKSTPTSWMLDGIAVLACAIGLADRFLLKHPVLNPVLSMLLFALVAAAALGYIEKFLFTRGARRATALVASKDGFAFLSEGEWVALEWRSIDDLVFGFHAVEVYLKPDAIGWRPRKREERRMVSFITGDFDALTTDCLNWGRIRLHDKGVSGRSIELASRPVLCLVGISKYTYLEPFNADADLRRMRDSLRSTCAECFELDLGGPQSLGDIRETLVKAFSAAAERTLILYITGHGFACDGRFFIAAGETDPARPTTTALDIASLLNLRSEIFVANLILILDTCYSGAAGAALDLSVLGSTGRIASTLFENQEEGLGVLAASAPYEPAYAAGDGSGSRFTTLLSSQIDSVTASNPTPTFGAIIDGIGSAAAGGALHQTPYAYASTRIRNLALRRSTDDRKTDRRGDAERELLETAERKLRPALAKFTFKRKYSHVLFRIGTVVEVEVFAVVADLPLKIFGSTALALPLALLTVIPAGLMFISGVPLAAVCLAVFVRAWRSAFLSWNPECLCVCEYGVFTSHGSDAEFYPATRLRGVCLQQKFESNPHSAGTVTKVHLIDRDGKLEELEFVSAAQYDAIRAAFRRRGLSTWEKP